MIEELRHKLRMMERPAGIDDNPGVLPLGIPALDQALGGGLARGALHEIAAVSEPHLPSASGFALALVAQGTAPVIWISEDMALAESGAAYGLGLEAFGLAPERLLTVAAVHRRDVLWAMEEALHCRAIGAVIGELRRGDIDAVATRRLSLAAAHGAPALLLRAEPATDASTAATRWIVGAAPSLPRYGPGSPRFAVHLVRNRRGPLGAWTLEWSDTDERFVLAATHSEPVAAPAFDRPHRAVA
jgi:protein ImuA